MTPKNLYRWIGREVTVSTNDGRKVTGTLTNIDRFKLTVETDTAEHTLWLDQVGAVTA